MAIVGKSVRITCKADASPPPEYKIFHNNTELTDVKNGAKTIMSANYNDSGKYKCIARNNRGNKSEIFNLTVKELKQPNASVNCSSPVIKNRGDEFACLCVGKGGYPPPTASWFKDFKNVGGSGYLSKALSLKNISKKDKGTYSCVADSHGLNDTKEIEIQVRCLAIIIIVVISCAVLVSLTIYTVIVYYCGKHNKCGVVCRSKKERDESEVDLMDGAATSGDGEAARVDSPPSMPPLYAVVDKKSMKKETPTDEEKPASGENNNAASAAGPSTFPPLYAAVDKVAQQKEQHVRPDSLNYTSLDPVVLQPDSSQMRDRIREEIKHATIDMGNLHSDKI